MDKFVIHGGVPLHGELTVAGAKNAALPLMAAALLTEEALVLQRIPDLWDVGTMRRLLVSMGVEIKQDKLSDPMQLQAATLTSLTAPYELVKTMRASILSLGPLLARCGEARVSLPGGCAIGARPVEQHIKGLTAMGAKVTLEEGYIHATAHRLRGARITTDMVTVTGTENLMMAACLADGQTVLENAAQEPEVVNLAEGLMAMGARIEGAGTNTITIEGVRKLHGATHEVMADRIEAGTYLCAAAVTAGHIRLAGIARGLMEAVVDKLEQMGCSISFDGNALELLANKKLKAVDIRTMPYPGFPTDLQAQFMAANCVAEGSATMIETIFENRFQHALELARLGANIHVEGRTAVVQGGTPLVGTTVMATDLRASAGLVVAALAARGVTTIERIYHLDRGYEKMEERLSRLGGRVERQ